MIILNEHNSKTGRTKIKSLIFVDQPHKNSLASLLLLNDFYKTLDDEFNEKTLEIQDYLNRRHVFLENILVKNGILKCHYCGRVHLEIGERLLSAADKNNNNPNLATIDHVVPVSSGIDKLDESNWVVSCRRCNSWKGAMDYFEFLKILPKLIANFLKKKSIKQLKRKKAFKKKKKKIIKILVLK